MTALSLSQIVLFSSLLINVILVGTLIFLWTKKNNLLSGQVKEHWIDYLQQPDASDHFQKAIQNDSEFVCNLLHKIHQGICIIDSDLEVKFMNKDLIDLLALPSGTKTSIPLKHLVEPDSYEIFKKYLTNTEQKLFEISWKRNDNTPLYTHVIPQALTSDKGIKMGIFALVVDITDQQKYLQKVHQENIQLEEHVRERTEELLGLNQLLDNENHERKKMERAMQSKNHMLENILATAEIFIVVLDRQGNISLVNRKGCIILGYDTSELLGENWFETCLPKDGKKHFFQSAFNELIQGKSIGALNYESYVLTKQGRTRLISWQNSLLYDENQKVIGVLRTGTDVTNQKRIIEELQKSEEKYRRLVDNSIAGIFQTSLDGDILYVNPAMPAIFGFTDQHEMLKLERNFFNENISNKGKILPLLEKEGRLLNYEMSVNTKQGRKRDIIVNAVLNRNIITGMVIDNTEIKITAAKLREREQQLTALFEQAADPMYLLNKEGKFIDVNPQACRELGYSREEFLSFNVADIDEDFKTRENEVWFWDKMPRNKSVTFEVRLRHKNGRKLPVEIKLTRYETVDNFLIFAMGRNLTERKKAEREIRIREERYWTLLESMSDAVYLLDNEYNYLVLNSTACQELGQRREDLIGKNILKLYPEKRDSAFF